jgi:hypothetical protein
MEAIELNNPLLDAMSLTYFPIISARIPPLTWKFLISAVIYTSKIFKMLHGSGGKHLFLSYEVWFNGKVENLALGNIK